MGREFEVNNCKLKRILCYVVSLANLEQQTGGFVRLKKSNLTMDTLSRKAILEFKAGLRKLSNGVVDVVNFGGKVSFVNVSKRQVTKVLSIS